MGMVGVARHVTWGIELKKRGFKSRVDDVAGGMWLSFIGGGVPQHRRVHDARKGVLPG